MRSNCRIVCQTHRKNIIATSLLNIAPLAGGQRPVTLSAI